MVAGSNAEQGRRDPETEWPWSRQKRKKGSRSRAGTRSSLRASAEAPGRLPIGIQRQEPGHHHSERDEVEDTVRREVGLIVGIEWLQDPMRNKAAEIRRLNGRGHDKSEKKVADREPERGLRCEHRLKRPGAAKGRPCAQNKQQLPCERVEIPGARRR